MRIYWRGWSEAQLASYQQDQGSGNHCAKYAAASSLNMLYGTSLAGETLVSWLETRLIKGTGRHTILGNNNGSLVYQTANLVGTLARLQGLRPEVKILVGTPDHLLESLHDGDQVRLVSLTYFQGREPVIARGSGTSSSLSPARVVGGHLMILAAHDPGHSNLAGLATPWGFLSSWGQQENLCWMSDQDFRRTWGRLSLFNTITIKK